MKRRENISPGRMQTGSSCRQAAASLLRLVTTVIFSVSLLLAAATSMAADKPLAALEDDIKAVYIYNFIRFTEWPGQKSANAREYSLTIMDNLQLLRIFRSEEFRKAAGDLTLTAQACDTPLCIGNSDALFIDKSMKEGLAKVLLFAEGKPLLTISDIPGFAEQGGMIELRREENRVVFRINIESVRKSGLYISAQLLQLAEIVGEKP